MDRLIETVDRPTEDRLDAFDAVYREVLDHNPLFGAYLKEQAAAFPTAIRLDLLVTARVRCAEVAVWILIHRDVRGGLPDELSEAFDTNTKPDPYTGEPLRYVRFEGGGFSVYSVGVDGYDDGGRRENERGESFGPGADVVFTVLGAEEP